VPFPGCRDLPFDDPSAYEDMVLKMMKGVGDHADAELKARLRQVAVAAAVELGFRGAAVIGEWAAGAAAGAARGAGAAVGASGKAIIGGLGAIDRAVALGGHAGAEQMTVDRAAWEALSPPAKSAAVRTWIRSVIARRLTVVNAGGGGAYTAIEIEEVTKAGYRAVGNLLVPP